MSKTSTVPEHTDELPDDDLEPIAAGKDWVGWGSGSSSSNSLFWNSYGGWSSFGGRSRSGHNGNGSHHGSHSGGHSGGHSSGSHSSGGHSGGGRR